MPYKPGHKKFGGRKKGSKNKKTIFNLKDCLARRDITPGDQLLNELALIVDPKDRFQGWLKILEFCEPKKRAALTIESEHKDEVEDEYVNMSDEALLRLVEDDDEMGVG